MTVSILQAGLSVLLISMISQIMLRSSDAAWNSTIDLVDFTVRHLSTYSSLWFGLIGRKPRIGLVPRPSNVHGLGTRIYLAAPMTHPGSLVRTMRRLSRTMSSALRITNCTDNKLRWVWRVIELARTGCICSRGPVAIQFMYRSRTVIYTQWVAICTSVTVPFYIFWYGVHIILYRTV